MNLRFLICAAVLLGAFASRDGHAQNPGAAPPVTHKKQPLKGIELIRWQYALAESSYTLNPVNSLYDRFIEASERMVTAACMAASLQTLEYTAPPASKECLEAIRDLETNNPHNPTAICARSGIDSPECISTFKNQPTKVYKPNREDLNLKDDPELELSYRLDIERNANSVTQARQDFFNLLDKQFKAANDPAVPKPAPAEIRTKAAKLLRQSCHFVRLKWIAGPVLNDFADAQVQATPTSDPSHETAKLMQELQNAMNPERAQTPSAAATASASAATKTRVRLISPGCRDAINQVRNALPDFGQPLCYLYGWYTPQCLRGLRKERQMMQNEPLPKPGIPSPPSSTVPFEEF